MTNNKPNEALLPCPFCASTDVKIVTCDGVHFAQCRKCEATGPTGFKRGDEDDADWNSRAQPADQAIQPEDPSPGFTKWFNDHGKLGLQHELGIEELMEGAYTAGYRAQPEGKQGVPAAWRFKEYSDNPKSQWLYTEKESRVPPGRTSQKLYCHAKPGPVAWTESDVLDFLSVALRHAECSGLAPSDILDGLRYMAEKGRPAHHAQPATAKLDENTEFEIWRNDQIESLERMGYQGAAKAFRNLGSVHWTGWQARAKLNGVSKVALPERVSNFSHHSTYLDGRLQGWNACLDEVAKLNGGQS